MDIDKNTAREIQETKNQKNRRLWQVLIWLSIMSATGIFYLLSPLLNQLKSETELAITIGVITLLVFSVVKCVHSFWSYHAKSKVLKQFHSEVSWIQNVISKGTAAALSSMMEKIKGKNNPLLKSLLKANEAYLMELIDARHAEELQEGFEKEFALFEQECLKRATDLRTTHPCYRALVALKSAESYLQERREFLDAEWKKAYEGFSWWNKLWYGDTPDFRALDEKIEELRVAQRVLLRKHRNELEQLKDFYRNLVEQAVGRVAETKPEIEAFISQCKYEDIVGQDVLRKGMWLSIMSVPISLWDDVSRAGDVYDVLRSVNGNYENLSDVEIWWETLFLPPESLAGLVSLTKGAYLESLVASDTGGQLFEHFNNPDTDIVIDGIAFQVKATDSTSYIDSVANGIPVIATSEVANVTDAIDSGYTNAELQETVNLAVGGMVVDTNDTAVDAVLTGLGGLTLFATLEGINQAVKTYENGGEPVEAVFEGAGVAIKGTARAAVNVLELGYNVLNSRPSRFVGRTLLKGAVAVDKKIFGDIEPNSRK